MQLLSPISDPALVAAAKQAFLVASKESWAVNREPYDNHNLNLRNTVVWQRKTKVSVDDWGFVVTDTYSRTPHRLTRVGRTQISAGDTLLWSMSYMGEYPMAVMPFLQEALMASYRIGHFCGGRGPLEYRSGDGKLRYTNFSDDPFNFTFFRGSEQIQDVDRNLLGHHSYMGMWLDP